jgi:DNA polymerase
MSIYIKNGILHVTGAQDKLRKKGQEKPDFLTNYTMLDIETTGLYPYRDRITELGGVKVRNGQIVDQYTNLVKFSKNNSVPAFITKLNGITEAQIVKEGIPAEQAIREFREFIGDDVIIGYNVNFDLNFLYDLSQKYGLPVLDNDYVDVLRLARTYYPRERIHASAIRFCLTACSGLELLKLRLTTVCRILLIRSRFMMTLPSALLMIYWKRHKARLRIST